jgi:hypothetical protein
MPDRESIESAFDQIEEKVQSRYVSDYDGYEELASDCCGPGRACESQQELCCPFSALRAETKEHILWHEIAWKEAGTFGEGGGGSKAADFTDQQIETVIANVVAGRPRSQWLEMALVKNEDMPCYDDFLKRISGDLKLDKPAAEQMSLGDAMAKAAEAPAVESPQTEQDLGREM